MATASSVAHKRKHESQVRRDLGPVTLHQPEPSIDEILDNGALSEDSGSSDDDDMEVTAPMAPPDTESVDQLRQAAEHRRTLGQAPQPKDLKEQLQIAKQSDSAFTAFMALKQVQEKSVDAFEHKIDVHLTHAATLQPTYRDPISRQLRLLRAVARLHVRVSKLESGLSVHSSSHKKHKRSKKDKGAVGPVGAAAVAPDAPAAAAVSAV